MGKVAQNRVLSDEARKKLAEFVAAAAACGFGPDGPPLETTFSEIEEFGHEVGRMVGRAVDQALTDQHADYFQGNATCPSCGEDCRPKEERAERDFQTSDGDIPLREPVFHCSVCDRDFFPSTHRLEN